MGVLMKKIVKKFDNNVVKVLILVCEIVKDWDIGFEWFIYFVRYDYFLGSLMVICVFNIDVEVF